MGHQARQNNSFFIKAEVLTGLPVTDLPTAQNAVRALQDVGSSCVVLTLGEKGLMYSQLVRKEPSEWSPIEHIPAAAVEVVDTTVSKVFFFSELLSMRDLSRQDYVRIYLHSPLGCWRCICGSHGMLPGQQSTHPHSHTHHHLHPSPSPQPRAAALLTADPLNGCGKPHCTEEGDASQLRCQPLH